MTARELYSAEGVPLTKQPDCPRCGHDEIGSHFDSAWCHACGWRGSIRGALAKIALHGVRDADWSLGPDETKF